MDNVQSTLSPDANNRIMTVAKGLQSEHLGIKCEAIADFSYIVKKYPFPVVFSPLFVRLVEAFKNGPNYLRLVILKNCEACKEHLGKINCASEIINMLSQNMDSNDPCSRAICLKLLGLLHSSFSNNKLIHHMIMLCLDSHHEIELNAAVEACNHYAPISNEFSTALCPKLCSKLESLSTDLKLKLKLIKLAKYLHHEADTFEKTRTCLISLLNGYQSLEFVINLLNTLTFLATKSSMHAQSQIEILLTQLDMEERDNAIIAVLNNLLILARHMAHIWTEDHVNILCSYYNKLNLTHSVNQIAGSKIVELLSILADSSCPSSIYVIDNPKNSVLSMVIESASKAALAQSSVDDIIFKINFCGIQLLCIIAQTTNDVELAEHTLNTYGVNVGNLWQKSVDQSHSHIFNCNLAVTKLILKFPELAKGFLTKNINIIVQELRDGRFCYNDGFSLICRFMAQFCVHVTMDTATSMQRATDVLKIVYTHDHRRSSSQVLSVCALIFQLTNCEGGALLSPTDTEHLIEWVRRCNGDNWLVYRVARMSNRYNQHGIACRLYEQLLPAAVSSKFIYWLEGLKEMSKAEELLMSLSTNDMSNLINNIVLSQKHLLRSTNFLKCSGTSFFQNAYITIRWQFLMAIYTLLVTLNQYGSKFTTNNPNFIVLMESKLLFESNIRKISDLISSSIDADDQTIDQLQWLRKLSSLFVQTLHAIISDYHPDVDISFDDKNCHQDYWLKRLCDEIFVTLTTHSTGQRSLEANNHQIADKIRLLTTLAMNSVKIGVPLPRFVFQKLQSTDVRLMAILNGKTITSETNTGISLRHDQSHKLQVFGIIQQTCKLAKLVRTVSQVRITVSMEMMMVTAVGGGHSVHGNKTPGTHGADSGHVANEVVKLNNDYFSTYILLDLKCCSAGKYQLVIKAMPIDAAGREWCIKDLLDCVLKVECAPTAKMMVPGAHTFPHGTAAASVHR